MSASLHDLIMHGLRALRDTLQQDKELTEQNLSIGIVGVDRPFEIIEEAAVQPFLEALKADGGLGRPTRKTSDVEMKEAEPEEVPPTVQEDQGPAPMDME